MKKNIIFFILISLSLAVTLSCSKKPGGTITVSEQELQEEVSRVITEYERRGYEVPEDKMTEIKQSILDQLVDRKILLAMVENSKFKIEDDRVRDEIEGIKSRYDSEEEFKEALARDDFTEEKLFDEIREVLTIQDFIEKEVFSTIKISKKEIEQFYNDNPQYFKNEETVTASHILIQVKEDATDAERTDAKRRINEILVKLQNGEDFVELAKKYSEGPSAPNGGNLGPFGRGKMVKPFEDAAFALNPGEISGIIETQFGYHVIKVFERADESTVPLDAVSDDISEHLRGQQQDQAMDDYIAKIKVHFDLDIPVL
ncbi:MAG: peptidylprolyl isomerase [Spirochaetales bacterium]|nr:peptidylprolyl isomerase [Spirochaetales bacterium]